MKDDPDPAALEGVIPIGLDRIPAPDPDPLAAPEGFLVANADTRLHFLDWGEPQSPAAASEQPVGQPPGGSAVLLIPGLLQPAWSWVPVARRLCAERRVLIADLRGQGLSDAPPDGYDLGTLASDAIAVAEGAGLMAAGTVAGEDGGGGPAGKNGIVVAGHGFGASVAAATADRLGARCAGLALIDGGWERLEETTDLDVEEFLRGLDEPPEVLRSMEAWLADRRGFDPASWDDDQERVAREAVVETAAGRVVRTVRPFVIEALVRTMFAYDPADVLPDLDVPIIALAALAGSDPTIRLAELERVARARAATGRPPIRLAMFPTAAHNLMRYRPADVTSAILAMG